MSAAVSRTFRNRLPLACSALTLATVLAATTLAVNTAQAQGWLGRGSWCTDMYEGGGYECSYFSYQQCMATASGDGSWCSRNPLYVAPQPQRHQRQRPRR